MLAKDYRIGVDIGGTFTDLVLYDPASKGLVKEKVLTTPDDPSEGVLDGIRLLLEKAGAEPKGVSTVIHGTTLVANALIERKGVALALITTTGFRDILEIGREIRYDTYDLAIELPAPLVERDLRFEVDERIAADGTVIEPLDLESLRPALAVMKRRGIQAIGVSLLHAYKNDAHERAVRDWLYANLPGVEVALSSEIMPEIGEYERTSTTVCNAYVQPLFSKYVARLADGIRSAGIDSDLNLMLSDGGTMHSEAARRFPIRLVQSGPAGGVQAAALIGKLTGNADIVCFDMGGTTAKACLIEEYRPMRTIEFEVARVWRFKKGSGLPLRVPVVNMIEIGAGGGSIAKIDRLGFTQVGPESASSKPGPACYGLGGEQPTVTDADLVLGYLDGESFLGGDMKLDTAAARNALATHVGGPLGISEVEAAWSIYETVTESMAQAAMIHALEMGKRLSDYTMVAIGGAGPVHACAVAERAGIKTVIAPAGAGVASAYGFLAAPISFELVRANIELLRDLDFRQARARVDELAVRARGLISGAGVAESDTVSETRCAARYLGQGQMVEFVVDPALLDARDADAIKALFETEYLALFGRVERVAEIEIVSWYVKVIGPDPKFQLSDDGSKDGREALRGSRPVYFRTDKDFVETPIYDRYALRVGQTVKGPALVEERESTCVIPPDAEATVDAYGNLVISIGK